jgi:hypothetical protein
VSPLRRLLRFGPGTDPRHSADQKAFVLQVHER